MILRIEEDIKKMKKQITKLIEEVKQKTIIESCMTRQIDYMEELTEKHKELLQKKL